MGSIEGSRELKKIPNLCFAQNLVEAYNMSVVIYAFQLSVFSGKCLPSCIFSIQKINSLTCLYELIFTTYQRLLIYSN